MTLGAIDTIRGWRLCELLRMSRFDCRAIREDSSTVATDAWMGSEGTRIALNCFLFCRLRCHAKFAWRTGMARLPSWQGKADRTFTAETQRAQRKAKGERQKLEGRRRSTETKANGEIETGPAVDGENREVTADCDARDVGRNADRDELPTVCHWYEKLARSAGQLMRRLN